MKYIVCFGDSNFFSASKYDAPGEIDREHPDADGHRKLTGAIFNIIEGVIENGY